MGEIGKESKEKKEVGLILEGGAMRGMFTAGVIDVLMEHNIDADAVIGVSAGACMGCNYVSKQPGRAIRYNKRFCTDNRYAGLMTLLRTGDIYGAKFCYHTIPEELDLLDVKTMAESPTRYYVVVTDMDTGKAFYHLYRAEREGEIEWMRASASMPAVSRPVELIGRKFSDGGTADSIPLRFFEYKGYRKNIVVLTQPRSYVKTQMKHFGMLRIALRKYPNLIKALEKRPDMYNETREYIFQREAQGEVFVICPPGPLNIGSVCHDPEELERVYQIGRKTAQTRLPELERYLGIR